MTDTEFFMAVKDLLDREHWTQGMLARNADGAHIDFRADDVDKLCLVGAMQRVAHLNNIAMPSIDLRTSDGRSVTIPMINDYNDYPVVIGLVDELILQAKELEQRTPME